MSYDTARRWKKEFDYELESSENAPKSGKPKPASCDELYQKVNEMLGLQYVM